MQRKHSVTDLLFALTLFCVFAVSALIVVVIGAKVYRSTVAGMSENYSTRTAIAYVGEKVRENDQAGSIQLGILPSDEAVPALSLLRRGPAQDIRVYVYFYAGALRELATTDEYANHLNPETGQVVAELKEASFEELESDLFRFTAVGENGAEELLFTLHSTVSGGIRNEK